ncbi:SulP family sulfate permease [Paraburkholderia sp. Clong3]|uniref:SulP family inorganic anion transporter n=1 Tax=unclassified Paraburkholderia TaxID=2615204 RepID=UPI001617E2AD|nr:MULTISPECIES: SulP family inorganic anion transporter [unclassified Paraburkholderia]MBB5468872.1 high affinity sulfate transporter 1 [Paraburkholderia sp. CI2]MBC8735872.1 SulP family inorganic anion transporter [Paraburkholderia sp. UCT31]
MKPAASTRSRLQHSPFLQGLLPFNSAQLPHDIIAGLTLAALGIPEVMGYTKISGTPTVTGLYTILLPLVAFALLGASRQLVVAADSATAAILAGTLTTVAALGSKEYIGLTSTVALTVAVMLVIARIFRLGFLADFLSRSALIGFLTGVGVQVAAGELAGLIGLAKQGHGPVMQLVSVVQRVAEANYPTTLLSLAVLAVIIGCKRLAPRAPGALIAVIGSIVASGAFNFAGHGIAVTGEVPGGLPSLFMPPLHMSGVNQVLATAASCFIVIIAQSAATARAYATRNNEKGDDNADIIGLAAANAAAAFTGTFVVNGSPTKTEIIDDAGGRTQVAHLTTAVIVLLVLLFLTRPLSLMPAAVLSAIVFMIGVKLIDVKGMVELFRMQKDEFVVALLAAGVVVFVDVMHGILAAVVLSLIAHARHSYRLRTRVLTRGPTGHWIPHHVEPNLLAAPGIVIYRFEADLFYANTGRFTEEVLKLVNEASVPLRWVVIDATEINNIDYTAGKTLLQLGAELDQRGLGIAVVAVPSGVRHELERYKALRVSGAHREIFATVDAAIDALRDLSPPASAAAPDADKPR